MGKTPANVLKFVAAKIEIQIGASETVPPVGAWTDLGLQSEQTLKLSMPKVSNREAGGGEVQQAYDGKVETDTMEVLNASTLETTFKNQYVWLKCTPKGTLGATNPGIYVPAFICNTELDLDLSAKGKSALKITGSKYCGALAEMYQTFTA